MKPRDAVEQPVHGGTAPRRLAWMQCRATVVLAVAVAFLVVTPAGAADPPPATTPAAAAAPVPAPTPTPAPPTPPATETAAPPPLAFDGGIVAWWTVIGLAVVALGLLFDGLLTARRGRVAPPATAEHLATLLRSQSYDDVLRLADDPAYHSLLVRVVAAAVALARDQPDATADEVRSEARDEGEAVAAGLYRRVGMLGALGAVLPMVGLLGTALGLSTELTRLAATGDAARAADIAGAAASALGTTVLSLLIAVPALLAANLLRARVDALTHEAGRLAADLIRPLGRR